MTLDRAGGAGAEEGRATAPALTVLVAEDDEALRSLLVDLLVLEGYAVLEASSGAQALRLARERLPEVILLDLALRGGSGLDVLEELRATAATRHIPVVMLSGCAGPGPGGRHPHPEVLLPKPFDIDSLLEHLSRAVGAGPAIAVGDSSTPESAPPGVEGRPR